MKNINNYKFFIEQFKKRSSLIPFFCIVLLNVACEDFLNIDTPNTQIVSEVVFEDDAVSNSAINGIYSEMMRSVGFASGDIASITVKVGLSADEFLSHNVSNDSFYFNSLDPNNYDIGTNIWNEAYRIIHYANAAIEGINNSDGITPSIKNKLLGEAMFIRAFCHFYLVNLFGDVPLITTTDYRINSVASRTSINEIYNQIISDLKEAQNLMTDMYPTTNKVRANKGAATALLARIYLYTEHWSNAEIQASSIIDNSGLYSLESDLNKVFLANSNEAIWQLMPIYTGRNTNEGLVFILSNIPNNISLSSSLYNNFETGDERFSNWVDSLIVNNQPYYFPYKYKINSGSTVSEYSMVLRLAEQYLIRAEARAQQGNISGAQDDLNIIRNRAGLTNTTASTQADLLLAIEHERQVELFAEWGHRWFDIKRTGRADEVLSPIKFDWQSTDALYPIPLSELNNDPNLTQNPGY